jgi:hypothetical protein
MATPANNAAVLSNSFFLMEWSSFHSSHPCGPMRIGSKENDLDRAQFRCRARFRAVRRRSVPMIRWNQQFTNCPWNSLASLQCEKFFVHRDLALCRRESWPANARGSLFKGNEAKPSVTRQNENPAAATVIGSKGRALGNPHTGGLGDCWRAPPGKHMRRAKGSSRNVRHKHHRRQKSSA